MLNNIIGSSVIAVVNLFLWSKFLEKKISFKDYRLYIGTTFMIVMIIVNFYTVNQVLKTVSALFILIITIKYIFNISIREAFILSVFNQLLYIISEIIVIIGVLMITDINNNEELVEVFFGTIYANIIISMVTFIVILIPFVKNLYKKILDIVKRQKVFTTILGIFIILIIVSILFNLIFYSNDLVISSSVGLILLSLYLFFLVKSIIEHNNYLNMYVKYNNSIETLKSYEAILDKYRLLNHENKNNLLTIRHMINKNNSEVSTFIDKLVKNEYQDDENLMMETSKIPSGGLRALIYSKLLYMKNNDVDFILKVDKKIRSVQLIDLNELLVLDICKIVGVFLDNAIEETKTIQNGNVSIELYMLDDRLNISIANTFEGTIDLDRMDEARYTTKGEDHGYGLSLVKEIINKNTKLENIRMINDNVFVQVLRIDM